MQTNVTFRHFNGQHPKLHQAALDSVKSFEKFHDGILSASIDFINEQDKIVQFTLNLQGDTIVAREQSDDFHKSLNLASDKVKMQIRKWKTKNSHK
jgi:ribosomal subunit interface protein